MPGTIASCRSVVTTKDCTALSDAELAEMADLCADRAPGFDIGFLSKEREEWVLVTQAREGNKLRGYSFCTLERIGGTPSLLVGLASVDRTRRAESALKAMMADQYRRALLAFPDEDVLLGHPAAHRRRLPGLRRAGRRGARARPQADGRGAGLGPAAGQALRGREPARRPHLRGRGRRLGWPAASTSWPPRSSCPTGSTSCSPGSTPTRGDRLVAFGWAMAEDLAGGKLGR